MLQWGSFLFKFLSSICLNERSFQHNKKQYYNPQCSQIFFIHNVTINSTQFYLKNKEIYFINTLKQKTKQ
ncbi:hypothetical protein pb186bvf_013292 [Paramecium bursaria]